MRFNYKTVSSLVLASTILITVGCSKDEEVIPVAVTPAASVITPAYTVPTTYAFVDAANVTTVNFNGQQQRLEMLTEMVTVMKTGNTVGMTVSSSTLKDMYKNGNGYTWIDDNIPLLGMTGSSKQLKSKTALGDAGVQDLFDSYIDSLSSLSVGSTSNSTETYGVSGVWTNGTKNYLMAENGYEYTQLIEKGLILRVD